MGSRGPSPASDQMPAPDGKPNIPAGLSKDEKRVWEQLIRDMEDVGTLARTDGAAIAACSRLMARAARLADVLDSDGWTYQDRTSIRARPEVSALGSTERLVQSYLIQFGLTPISRSRVKIEKPIDDDLAAFKAGR